VTVLENLKFVLSLIKIPCPCGAPPRPVLSRASPPVLAPPCPRGAVVTFSTVSVCLVESNLGKLGKRR